MGGALAICPPSVYPWKEAAVLTSMGSHTTHRLCAVSLALWVSALTTSKAAWIQIHRQAGPDSQGHSRPVGIRGRARSAWGPCMFCQVQPHTHWGSLLSIAQSPV